MERGRPRTRRIIARVILPWHRLPLSLSPSPTSPLSSLSTSVFLASTLDSLGLCTRVNICMQEELSRIGDTERRWKERRCSRRRSEVSRTLDEADATPTERHPRENPSPRASRLLPTSSSSSSSSSSPVSSPSSPSSSRVGLFLFACFIFASFPPFQWRDPLFGRVERHPFDHSHAFKLPSCGFFVVFVGETRDCESNTQGK